jgi:hypothetical protein
MERLLMAEHGITGRLRVLAGVLAGAAGADLAEAVLQALFMVGGRSSLARIAQ